MREKLNLEYLYGKVKAIGELIGTTLIVGGYDVVIKSIKDEDNMASDSDEALATQQSIKAYVDDVAKTDEEVQDIVGAMVSGNTETFITVTYEDGDGTIDFVVAVKDEDDMASDSEAHLATQQSVKAYITNQITNRDREYEIVLVDSDTSNSVGDEQANFRFVVPDEIDGFNLKSAHAFVYVASTSGAITVQIRNITDSVDMLSTAITIDQGEKTSYTAATQPVVDTSNDDVSRGDEIAIDLDGAGVGSKGLGVVLVFEA